jgi:type I restriction enzyme S subunit
MRDGWVETRLGDIARVTSGFAFSTKSWREQGIPVVKINNVRNGQVSIENCSFIAEPVPEGASKFLLKQGDLLITLTGEIGAIGFVTQTQPMYLNQRVGRLDLLDEDRVLIKFIGLFLTLPEVRAEMWSHGKGNAQLNISPTSIHSLIINLPPLQEQNRIVDLINSVDSYIEALQQQLESAKRSRNAVLHELLTAGGDDWETTTIGDISDFVSVRKSPEQLSADSIYVGLEHLEPNNTSIDHFDSVSKVTSSLTPFDDSDVLFGRLRPYLHKVAIAEMFGFCSPEILVLRANSKVLPQMLLLFCDADSTINICVERSAGTRMPRTSTEDLASIEIKLPPIEEQIKLAELSSTFDTVISHLGIALEKSRILRSGLLSDLLSGTHEIPTSYEKVIGAA